MGGLVAGCPVRTVWVGPIGGDSASGEGNTCAGQCVPLGPYEEGWTEPALLWIGDPSKAPNCPKSAPVGQDVGFADPNAPNPCGACACDPPAGSCTLSTTWAAHNTATCSAAPGSVATSFNAAPGWDGACTTANAIAGGALCKGLACVQSLSIDPLTITESGCTSRVEPALIPKDSSTSWGTLARVCRGHASGECGDPSELCTPSATLPHADATSQAFALCVSHEGDLECSGTYSVRHVFYESLVDNRTCTPCECGAPTGSVCKALVSAFSDGSCSSLIGSYTIDATKTACFDVLPAGQPLGSKSADEPVFAPGACPPSGGATIGEVILTDPRTFCCLP
jgi:hypothetical protein